MLRTGLQLRVHLVARQHVLLSNTQLKASQLTMLNFPRTYLPAMGQMIRRFPKKVPRLVTDRTCCYSPLAKPGGTLWPSCAKDTTLVPRRDNRQQANRQLVVGGPGNSVLPLLSWLMWRTPQVTLEAIRVRQPRISKGLESGLTQGQNII